MSLHSKLVERVSQFDKMSDYDRDTQIFALLKDTVKDVLGELKDIFNSQTELKEVGKSEDGKSIMKTGKKTLFELERINKIIHSLTEEI